MDKANQYWTSHSNGDLSVYDFLQRKLVEKYDKVQLVGTAVKTVIYSKFKEDDGHLYLNVQFEEPRWPASSGLVEMFDMNLTTKAMLRYDRNMSQFVDHIEFEGERKLVELTKKHILLDQADVFWFYDGFLHRESNVRRGISTFPLEDQPTQLFEDSRGRVWIGARKGIYRMSEPISQTHLENKDNYHKVGWVNTIMEDSKHTIWIGTRNGLFIYSEQDQDLTRLSEQEDLVLGPIKFITEDHAGHLWIMNEKSGIYLLDPISKKIVKHFNFSERENDGLPSKHITGIFIHSNGDIFLTSWKGNFNVEFDKQKEAFVPLILDLPKTFDIQEDQSGRIWVSGESGVFHFHPDSLIYHQFEIPELESNDEITIGRAGQIWISGLDGLALIDLKYDTTRIFDFKSDFLEFSILTGIIYDRNDQLWVPTLEGLYILDANTFTQTKLGKSDGIRDLDYLSPLLARSNGDILLGSKDLYEIKIDELLASSESDPPRVLLTELEVMNKKVKVSDHGMLSRSLFATNSIDLNYQEKDISITATAIHYDNSSQNIYSWKLENYDRSWSKPSKERRIHYTNLPPGTHTLKVKAANFKGQWSSKPTELAIQISPPWWDTTGAHIFYGLTLCYLVWQIQRYQKRRTLIRERERVRIRELAQAKEIEKAYTQLKATQSQLIHSEKMASLGELTAGIAHEIQNPLNFVNNFSEVSGELIHEAKEELDRGDVSEAKAILDDLNQNLNKINHHGERASSIVKGMLDHSRSSAGEKVATDVNNLCDEYIRLAYHGMRAKDKSFNVMYETDFQDDIPPINIVPQDIGRVILNLVNNAFQAVQDYTPSKELNTERTQSEAEEYQPMIKIKTALTGGHPGFNLSEVEVTTGVGGQRWLVITISDNGPGIPDEIRDKIFQPFFTTKATGQGTGLGLSLSYDIVKAHGGNLSSSSVEGAGSAFQVRLPFIDVPKRG